MEERSGVSYVMEVLGIVTACTVPLLLFIGIVDFGSSIKKKLDMLEKQHATLENTISRLRDFTYELDGEVQELKERRK